MAKTPWIPAFEPKRFTEKVSLENIRYRVKKNILLKCYLEEKKIPLRFIKYWLPTFYTYTILMRRCPKISANFCRIETTPFSCMILRLTQKWYYWRPVHLPILVQYLIFISHEKVRKPKVFWRFQKTWNRTIEIKWVELIQAR